MIRDIERLFIYLSVICMFSLKKHRFMSFAHFKSHYFIFCYIDIETTYLFGCKCVIRCVAGKYFLPFRKLSLHSVVQKLLSLMQPHFSIFAFVTYVLVAYSVYHC